MQHRDGNASGASAATAGFLNTDWSPRDLPAGTTTRNVVLRTTDDAACGGSLYLPAGRRPNVVVCVMHPREFMACHYLIPDIVSAGFAAWSQSPRSVGNDIRLEHEIALHDVAAGMRFLKGEGFEKIVVVGNSGGAGLFCLYAQQAVLDGSERIERTPAGRPTSLEGLEMPPVDGLVLVAPHPGQGALLLNCIDPSVVDETSALEADSTLDPLNPENGYAGPGKTRYAETFTARYRAAQRSRVERIDTYARSLLSRRMDARRRVAPAGTPDALVARLNDETSHVLAQPEVVSALQGAGLEPMPMTVAQMQSFVGKDSGKWAELIRDARIKVEQ